MSKAFHIPLWQDAFARSMQAAPWFWQGLAEGETRLLAKKLADHPIDRPIYVTGLARSGTTLVLEMLADHRDTVSHQYGDYPFIQIPWFWQQFVSIAARRSEQPTERSHQDKMMVTSKSPEAFEEILWQQAWGWEPLDASHSNDVFEAIYRSHIQKLLLAKDGSRYLTKGNNHVTRLRYLAKLMPDARFVIPVRQPVAHIASLMKQHRVFSEGQQGNDAFRRYLAHVGHYEFGMDRRVLAMGDADTELRIMTLWERGEAVRGWAAYWAYVYGRLREQVLHDDDLMERVLWLPYEDLCMNPAEMIDGLLAFCALPADGVDVASWASRIAMPSYYQPSFSEDELRIIEEETVGVSRQFF